MEWYGLHLNKGSLKKGVLQDTPLNALAFFLGGPQAWRTRKCSDKEAALFRSTLATCKTLSPEQVVVHGCYLMNPASEREDVVLKTGPMFLNELAVCEKMGVGKYVFHPGCSKKTQEGLQCTVDLIKAGLQETKNVQILVENMTQTNRLCQTWEECRWVLDHVNDPRLGFCMDTAHCWGAGPKKRMFMDTLLDDFDRVVGIEHLGAIHLNDSKVAYGSNKDRHEDILVGQIPHSFWNKFVFDERVRRIPAILETPTNCMDTLKMIIENGGVPNTEPKEPVTVTIVEKESKQTSLDAFFVPHMGGKRSADDRTATMEENNQQAQRKLDKVALRSEQVSQALEQDIKEEVMGFLSPLEKLEELMSLEWQEVLAPEFEKKYFLQLKEKLLEEEKAGKTIFPPTKRIFRALNCCKPSEVKVILCGQDCYIRKGQAEGLSFSVPKGMKVPPSLKRIYKELETDIPGFKAPYHGHLGKWAEQGVLLLNASLTVREGKSNSHAGFGWQEFTDAVLRYINDNCQNVVFILMGKFAQRKCDFINTRRHYVVKTAHPSPMAGNAFFGSKPFSKCNEFLRSKGINEIDWRNY